MRRNQRGTKGTYRLVLELPEKGGPFALELPEIEGASRVYIGGELVREWGSIEDVRSGMKRFVFPLTQGRDTELIIQAAALGAFHSQNFSPPLLGVYDAVTGIRDVGLLLKVMVLGLAVSAAGLSLHLAVKIRWWRGFLFCLFCLCFVGYQLWPLARERIQLGLQPWYGIQVFCFYAMLWLMVILENDLYRIKGGKVSAAMGIFCILALVYGCYAQYGTAAAADLFSYITQWYKFAIACHLILVAYMAMAEGMGAFPDPAGNCGCTCFRPVYGRASAAVRAYNRRKLPDHWLRGHYGGNVEYSVAGYGGRVPGQNLFCNRDRTDEPAAGSAERSLPPAQCQN